MNKFVEKLKERFQGLILRVSLQERVILARHLSIMIKAGMPLLDSLILLKDQTKSKALAKILTEVARDVSNGQFLSKSLSKFKSVFGELFVNIILVGETSGTLAENLNYLSEELKKKAELRRKVIGALLYPIIIVVATLSITGLLTIFIFPKILPVFASLGVELPLATRILIAVSGVAIASGVQILLGAAALLAVLWLLGFNNAVRFFYHQVILLLPLVGKMSRHVNLTNFSRTLGLLLKSGVKIVEALNISADTLDNLVYRKEIKEAAFNIQKGASISKHLGARRNLFPGMFTNMVAVGENTGNLSEALIYLADFYESEVGETTRNLSNILEPALMVIMGLLVGFVAISIITPIYELTQTIGS